MALQQDTDNTAYGIDFQNSYVKITKLGGDTNVFKVVVDHYANQAASRGGAKAVESRVLFIPFADFPAADNPIQGAYEWLKQQEAYNSATDV